MKKILFLLLLLPFLVNAQEGTAPVKTFKVPGGKGGGMTAAQLAELNARLDAKKDIDPNEIPFTAEQSATLANIAARPVIDTDSIQKKTDDIDPARIKKIVVIDSLGGIALHSNFQARAWRMFGSKVKAFTLNCPIWEAGDSTMVEAGGLRLHAVPVDRDTVVTAIGFRQYRAGDYTAGTLNAMSIYRLNAALDTLFLVAQTANNGNLFKAANRTDVSEPLTASVILKAGAYYAGYIHTRTAVVTPPSMNGGTVDPDLPDRWAGSVAYGYHAAGTVTFPAFIRVSTLTANKDKRLLWFE